MIETDILIVGRGLAGLSLAARLTAQSRDFVLLDARDRFGGRILGQDHGGATFDMGPAWFWPGQPRIAALIKRYGLGQFDQFATGDVIFENECGHVQQVQGYATMDGSFRLRGGLRALITALCDDVDPDRLHLGVDIKTLEQCGEDVIATSSQGQVFKARQVVLALPPRLAGAMSYTPALPADIQRTMTGIATWMAGHAKAVAVYESPFWRDAGLSGDAISGIGPLAEIHDASPEGGGPFALFGFVGVPPAARTDEKDLRTQVLAQLRRMFGEAAAHPAALYIKDWAFDPYTSTRDDMQPLLAHPRYGMPDALRGLWGDRLIFGGTEVAPQFGGFVEGALEAAEWAATQIKPARVGTGRGL